MRVTIIVSDNLVSVDGGTFNSVDCEGLAADEVHAVQWYDEDYGEVEYITKIDPEAKIYVRAPNEIRTDFEYIEPYVKAWMVKEAARLTAEQHRKDDEEKARQQIEEEIAKAQAEHEARIKEEIANLPPLPRLDPYEVVDLLEQLRDRIEALEKK